MRKLRPAEVAILVSGLAIGSGNVFADESGSPLATVTVTGSYNLSTQFVFPSGLVSPSTSPGVSGTNSIQAQQAQSHAIACTLYYGQGIPWGVGPKPGYTTTLSVNYGWSYAFDVIVTTTNVSPGPLWIPTQAMTVPKYGNPFYLGYTYVFLNSNPSTGTLINTLAHEWAHQWGADEPSAQNVGNWTEAAWRADNGRQCGGL
jgi:hypothetical protein